MLQHTTVCLALCLAILPGLGLSKEIDLRRADNVELGNAIYTLVNGNPLQAAALLELADNRNRLGDDKDLARMYLADICAEQGLRTKAMQLYRELGERGAHIEIKDLAWLKLAKLALEDQQFAVAKQAIYDAGKTLTNEQETERTLINAHILMAEKHPEQAVVLVSENLVSETQWSLYQRYNLGVLLLKHFKNKHGAVLLHKLGEMDVRNNPERAALRDQANLSLGFTLIQLGNPVRAREYLKKVQLNGALSEQALLGMGWTYSSSGDYERALVYWQELQQRPLTNAFYYESLLAIPYALSQAEAYKQAAERYESAIDQLRSEIVKLTEAQKAIRDHRLSAILNAQPAHETDWLGGWQKGVTPENHFLPLLMQNIKFQGALREQRSLLLLQTQLAGLKDTITQFEQHPQASHVRAEISRSHLNHQTLATSITIALNAQQSKVDSLAVEILDSYKTQLANYTRQAQFGLAQVIEHATEKTGHP
ncbi:MAG: hypothetical protein HY272_10260 [Gammaproteobacteria bacterium]|nr:hypothetical protein [Gammaproteobacteria bacterium]